jgi:ABC-2 type transport system permease protein
MRNIWLIIRREYVERVHTKSFLITTILFPAMMLGFTIVPGMLAGMKTGGTRHIVAVADNADFANAVKAQLAISKNVKYAVEVNTSPSEALRAQLKSDVGNNKLDGFLWLTDDAVKLRKVTYMARETSDFVEVASLESALRTSVLRQQLMSHGATASDIDTMMQGFDLEAIALKGGREQKSNGPAQFISAIVMVMMLYMTLLIYGMSVMRSVLEEKTSRVMEVVLSSAKASELMAGKILGVGAVGLTQVAIWIVIAAGASAPAMLAMAGVKDSAFHIDMKVLPAFAVFFVLGYMLYSTLFAALGAMVNSEQEAQQWQTFVTLPIVVPIVMMMFVIRQPNAPVSIWMSMVPFFAPILMFLRIMSSQPPHWYEIAASIGILIATIWGVIWLCSRIYRVGILMYGKKPTLPEIMKWVKYA